MMQVYLFIVCNHATEPNPLLLRKAGKRRRKEGHKSDHCHAEPEGMLLRMLHCIRYYQQDLALRQPLPFLLRGITGVSTHLMSCDFNQLATHIAHRENTQAEGVLKW